MCCLIFSRRGLAYFGVLLQLLVALLIVPLITLLIAFTTTGPYNNGSGRHLSLSEIIFVTLYCITLCILAAVIFRGIRTNSLRSLYISIASLLIVQVSAGVMTLLSWRPSSFQHDKEALIKVTCLGLNGISSVTYLIILICYTNYLRNKLKSEFEDEESDFYQKSHSNA